MIRSKTQTAVVCSGTADSDAAGRELGKQLRTEFAGEPADALILFCSPRHAARAVLNALDESCAPKLIVGCSTAGEFTGETLGEGQVCAIAIRSSEMVFTAGMGRGLSTNRHAAASDMVANFRGVAELPRGYCTALVLTDGLAGHADELVEELTFLTGGHHQFFGGGAGDHADFRKTEVYLNQEVASDAAVALEMISEKPIGVGVQHGWYPASKPLRVTEARGKNLVSLNAVPAAEFMEIHAKATGQVFDRADPQSFFLHNIFGIAVGDSFKLRVPLSVLEDGTIVCAAEIPEGASVRVMATDAASTFEAAAKASRAALMQLNGNAATAALCFDCVATRLRMGREFGGELAAIREVLGAIPLTGCNTYGQVARTEGQFTGFHNCTAVVCVLPA